MKYSTMLREEELKNKVAVDFFQKFDASRIIANIDFAVGMKDGIFKDEIFFLWAEAKQKSTDILAMLAQLILTIGKARTFDKIMPPQFLGCFDNEKIALVPYSEIQDIFYQNDFNWNVAPSNHDTREFKQVYEKIKNVIENDIPSETYLFDFEKDEQELRRFIRENFIVGKSDTSKIRIDKNNFINIYQKWFDTVKPTISFNWEAAASHRIIGGDFYLADLLSDQNATLLENLDVVLRATRYEMNRFKNEFGAFTSSSVEFTDNQRAHNLFWARYERPPLEDYWNYIIERRDLLVPQDIRERKGSFYTPRIWVEKSQEYLAQVFGENWQDEYYVWDCAAGTGNLLAGLTNKYNLWASTLDKQDVDVMKQRIANGANLLEEHVFQFDFLNDDFSKLPDGLQKIISNPKLRQRLIIYINPPYAEVSSYYRGKKGANQSKIHDKYIKELGTAGRELFAQFFIRINKEIPDSKLAAFNKMKYVSGSAFEKFRNNFLAQFKKGFICIANFFDNVSGNFPIGFLIWNLEKKDKIKKIKCDILDNDGKKLGIKNFYVYENSNYINKWISKYNKKPAGEYLGFLAGTNGNDFQANRIVYIINKKEQMPNPRGIYITVENLIVSSVYFAVRKVIPATWINDRDQFLYPNKKWEKDTEFHNDCLTYALFSNNISSKYGVNHWIPFKEEEVNARTGYESHFMISFLSGKKIFNAYSDLFLHLEKSTKHSSLNWEEGQRRAFSVEAEGAFEAGRELWRYYHSCGNVNVNASLYDIKEHFQGRNDSGKMNSKSSDEKYNALIAALRDALKILAAKIEPKVYEYEFLME